MPAVSKRSFTASRIPSHGSSSVMKTASTPHYWRMDTIRPCRDDDRETILAIVNAAAEAYRGVIPADRWHEPYMDRPELEAEIAGGVEFWGYEQDGALVGVMGIQRMEDVDLIRQPYVEPAR